MKASATKALLQVDTGATDWTPPNWLAIAAKGHVTDSPHPELRCHVPPLEHHTYTINLLLHHIRCMLIDLKNAVKKEERKAIERVIYRLTEQAGFAASAVHRTLIGRDDEVIGLHICLHFPTQDPERFALLRKQAAIILMADYDPHEDNKDPVDDLLHVLRGECKWRPDGHTDEENLAEWVSRFMPTAPARLTPKHGRYWVMRRQGATGRTT